MAADLGFVPDSAERDAHELPARRLGDGLAQRCLADPGRTDQAEDGALERAGARLHRQVLQDALLDLLQAIVVVLEDGLRAVQVDRPGLRLAPRDGQEPVEVVPDHGGFRGHRAHRPQLLQLGVGLGAGLLGQAGALDALFQLGQLVALGVLFAQLALDRLHLLVQVVLALGLLHLPLHAVPDLLLGLHDRDLALHEGVDLFQALGDAEDLQQFLLVGDPDVEVRGDAVGQLAGVLDARQGGQGLGRHLLVQLNVGLELLDHGAAQGLDLGRRRCVLGHQGDLAGEPFGLFREADDAGAAATLDEHLHRAVGQAQELEDGRHDADLEDVVVAGIVVVLVLLGDEQDLARLGLHGLLEGADGLVASDEERDGLVREDDDVPQGEDRKRAGFSHVHMYSRASPSIEQGRRGPPATIARSGQMLLDVARRPPGSSRPGKTAVDNPENDGRERRLTAVQLRAVIRATPLS